MVDCACTNFPAGLGNVTIGASLGVGTTTPAFKLDVQGGTTRLKGLSYEALYLAAPGPSAPTTALIRFRTSDQTNKWMFGMGLGGPGDEGFGLYGHAGPAPDYRLYVLPNGNVGIGTNAAQHRLDVQGGVTRLKGSATDVLNLDASGPGFPTTAVVNFRDHLGASRWWFGAGLSGAADQGFGLYGYAGPAPGYRLYASLNGNVGIGRDDPQARLHVGGTLMTDQNVGIGTAPTTARLVVRSPNDVASTSATCQTRI